MTTCRRWQRHLDIETVTEQRYANAGRRSMISSSARCSSAARSAAARRGRARSAGAFSRSASAPASRCRTIRAEEPHLRRRHLRARCCARRRSASTSSALRNVEASRSWTPSSSTFPTPRSTWWWRNTSSPPCRNPKPRSTSSRACSSPAARSCCSAASAPKPACAARSSTCSRRSRAGSAGAPNFPCERYRRWVDAHARHAPGRAPADAAVRALLAASASARSSRRIQGQRRRLSDARMTNSAVTAGYRIEYGNERQAEGPRMHGFSKQLRMQRWDDHRYYHHSRINQCPASGQRHQLPVRLCAGVLSIPARPRCSAGWWR